MYAYNGLRRVYHILKERRLYLSRPGTVAMMMVHGGDGEHRIRQRLRADLFTRESRFIKAIGIDEKIAPIEGYHAANAGE